MERPAKLSENVFLELPPVLSHYLAADRNLWLEGNPKRGRISLLGRTGNFVDLEALAVERRQLIQTLGSQRARALRYRCGFEQGRRDGARHLQIYGENVRLALQAALVHGQLQGRFVAESVKFEFNLDARTLYRQVRLDACAEAVIHRMTLAEDSECVCWGTAGYLSGHVSEIVGRRALTMETDCICQGGECCRFVMRLEPEWGDEADWVREAMQPVTVEEELQKRDEIMGKAQKAARRAQASLNDLHRRMRSELLMDTLVSESEGMRPVVQRARQLSMSGAPVFVTGEKGVGKETVARAIHFGSPRRKKPFAHVDCTVLSGALLARELFGYEEGAVPGLAQTHQGALARAHGGTLYLSDIEKMDPELQGRILQVLKEGCYTADGAEKATKVDIRFMAGMQRGSEDRIEETGLREDLYYALSVGRLDLPPLRERPGDILPLAEAFLQEFRERYERPDADMSPAFKQVLLDCAWPGNLRQLRNVLEHAVVLAHNRELTPADLPDEILAARWKRPAQDLTPEVITAALKRTHNNRSAAARLLGVGRTTLWRAMKRVNIE